jgi:hypothetical protein
MSSAAIYLVANKKSQDDFSNLIYSIRSSGCELDIILIPFGGEPIEDQNILNKVKVMHVDTFPPESLDLINRLQGVLQCPQGFLRRFLAFYGPYEKFIYSDNDIVALSDWSLMINHLSDYDFVHADNEYKTQSRYNFKDVSIPEALFDPSFHLQALTAGHFAAIRSQKFIDSFYSAIDWMAVNHKACKLHDQTLFQVASLLGRWKSLNLCKEPNNYLSSWAGAYPNTLNLIQKIQNGNSITHLHYAGAPTGLFFNPIDELLLSSRTPRDRQFKITSSWIKRQSGYNYLRRILKKLKRRLT